MTKHFEDIKVNYDELARQEKELIELRRKNEEAFKHFLNEFHKKMDELVAIQLAN